MEKTMVVKPYDYDVTDDIFTCLFCDTGHSTDKGLIEIPAASYQLVVSALEAIKWEVTVEPARQIINNAISIVEILRDCQKVTEHKRKHS